jgi:hypothetical protein
MAVASASGPSPPASPSESLPASSGAPCRPPAARHSSSAPASARACPSSACSSREQHRSRAWSRLHRRTRPQSSAPKSGHPLRPPPPEPSPTPPHLLRRLHAPHLRVDPALARHQLRMRPLLRHLSLPQHIYPVAPLHRGQPVRHKHRGPPRRQLRQRRQDPALGGGVQRGGGLVADQQPGLPAARRGDGAQRGRRGRARQAGGRDRRGGGERKTHNLAKSPRRPPSCVRCSAAPLPFLLLLL